MSRMIRTTIVCSVLSLGAFSALAGPAYQTHDGFLLRLSIGAAGSSTKVEYINLMDEDEELELSGPGGDVNIAIGGMVSESLALHATLFGVSMTDPDAKFRTGLSGELPGSFTTGVVGIGVTNYFMPSNLYLSTSVGIASFSIDLDGLPTYESDPGFGFDLTFGKEWWTAANWGLGLAGGFQYHKIPDQDGDDWVGSSFGIRFSATFN